MATLSTDKNGLRLIQFSGLDGRRKTLRLGRAKQRTADTIRTHVEELLEARKSGRSAYDETTLWVAKRAGDKLCAKLAGLGLIPKRQATEAAPTLGPFLAQYVASRTDLAAGTTGIYQRGERCLLDYFGAGKCLSDITPGECDEFRRWLARPKNAKHPADGGRGLARNTVSRRICTAKTFFRAAIRKRLIAENPFEDMRGLGFQDNPARSYFVTREVAYKVLDACDCVDWRTLFALARFAGLRVSSETNGLRWQDVNWDEETMLVHSPKTASRGRATRIVPIFPELKFYLREAFEQAEPGAVYVVGRLRADSGRSFGIEHLKGIIRAAGFEPWPKLFNSLRAALLTELADHHPIKAVADWMGNSPAVAQKHYAKVTGDHFKKAVGQPTGDMPPARLVIAAAG